MIVGMGAEPDAALRRGTFFYGSAREGFGDLLAAMPAGRAGRVLLPGYIGYSPREGSGVLDPIVAAGMTAAFYPLTPDLRVDLDSLRATVAAAPVDVVVVIHYFGRTEPATAEVRRIADDAGALLVEDLAHGLFAGLLDGRLGRFGHASLFSLHKMLPMPGGMVRYAAADGMLSRRETRPELAHELWQHDLSTAAARRRANFDYLVDRLRDVSGLEVLWEELADDEVPQSLPVRVDGTGVRDRLYERMNALGFGLVSLYHTLVDEAAAAFPDLVEVSRTITNLPVHQGATVEGLDRLVDALVRCR